MRGRLIVLDGIDGGGKTLQTEILVDRLEREGYNPKTINFPQYDKNFFGSVVASYLNGELGNSGDVHPKLASIPYAGDRWESSPKIRRWKSQGKIVVSNRYASANKGHQGGKLQGRAREEFLEWLDTLEYEVLKIPRPDLNVLLKLDPEIAQRLVLRKKKRSYTAKEMDIHEASIRHLENSLECFLEIAEQNPDKWKIIDCTDHKKEWILKPEEIAEEIWQHVSEVLTK